MVTGLVESKKWNSTNQRETCHNDFNQAIQQQAGEQICDTF